MQLLNSREKGFLLVNFALFLKNLWVFWLRIQSSFLNLFFLLNFIFHFIFFFSTLGIYCLLNSVPLLSMFFVCFKSFWSCFEFWLFLFLGTKTLNSCCIVWFFMIWWTVSCLHIWYVSKLNWIDFGELECRVELGYCCFYRKKFEFSKIRLMYWKLEHVWNFGSQICS